MTWMDSGSILSWAFTNQGGGRGGQNKNIDMYFSQMYSTICPQQLLTAQCGLHNATKKMAKATKIGKRNGPYRARTCDLGVISTTL